jgi:hypothetical protein
MLEPLTELGSTPTLGRFLLYESDDFAGLDGLPALSSHFALFMAFDLSEVADQTMLECGRRLLGRGLAYACCWGEDCERWHDAIDVGRLELHDDPTVDNVIMTTWHEGESLEDALYFFGRLALPAANYLDTCVDYVIAASPNYTDVIRRVICFQQS